MQIVWFDNEAEKQREKKGKEKADSRRGVVVVKNVELLVRNSERIAD